MRVVVVGAGAIGAAAALDLARRGADVTVLDRGPVGGGCSYGNAGWLTPSLATPLPAPGVLTTGLRWLLDPESPLYVVPSLRPSWFRWMGRFALSATAEKFERGTRALMELSRSSLEAFAALDRERPGSFGFSRSGLVMVALSPASLKVAHHEGEAVERRGVAARPLDAAAVRAIEPAIRGEVAGGVLFPDEAHCEPLAAVEAMADAARAAGSTIRSGIEVTGFRTAGRRIAALFTPEGDVEADAFVLATGSASKRLGARLGLRIPLLDGKGYAITVRGLDPAPRLPIKVLDRRIAITPCGRGTRLAGTLELVDGDDTITERRVQAIVKGSRLVLSVPERPDVVEVWRGLRPCTPDGLPVIGRSPLHDNLYLATGHQMCGLHTAPATGRLIGDLVTATPPSFDPFPFRLERF
jgi:D-amino-acid dehydrogenase